MRVVIPSPTCWSVSVRHLPLRRPCRPSVTCQPALWRIRLQHSVVACRPPGIRRHRSHRRAQISRAHSFPTTSTHLRCRPRRRATPPIRSLVCSGRRRANQMAPRLLPVRRLHRQLTRCFRMARASTELAIPCMPRCHRRVTETRTFQRCWGQPMAIAIRWLFSTARLPRPRTDPCGTIRSNLARPSRRLCLFMRTR